MQDQTSKNSQQELLIKAICDQSSLENAHKHLQTWLKTHSLDVYYDHNTNRILPHLYRKFSNYNLDQETDVKTKRIYFDNLSRNGIILKEFVLAVEALNNCEIIPACMKGVALVLDYYQEKGSRWMGDLDFLISREHVRPAITALEQIGWKIRPEVGTVEDYLDFRHAIHFSKNKLDLDLHWSLFDEEFPSSQLDQEILSTAEQCKYLSTRYLKINPNYLFVHLLAHGARYNVESLYWIVDVVQVLKRSKLDTNRISKIAEKIGLPRTIKSSLFEVQSFYSDPTLNELDQLLTSIHLSIPEFLWLGFVNNRSDGFIKSLVRGPSFFLSKAIRYRKADKNHWTMNRIIRYYFHLLSIYHPNSISLKLLRFFKTSAK